MSYKEKSVLYFLALMTVSIFYYQVEQNDAKEMAAEKETVPVALSTSDNETNTAYYLP
ncbi:hypothetical protein [Maribacter sp. 2-571]|uniref:hypothetical protein n=1 Tax=Maribacter sp. 2-571 TaxID=3417569 RepID=UPI003D3364E2